VLEQSLKELDHEIENTSQALSLQTALPDEVVGNALASNQDRQIQRAASLKLNTERVNPAWTELIKRRSTIVKNLAQAKATAAELGAIIPAKNNDVMNATKRAFKADQGSTIIQKQILRFTGINNTLFSGYSEMKQDLFATNLRMTLLEPEIQTMAQTIESLHSDIDRLRESYEAAAAELEVLNLRKTAVEKRAELVTQKLQESLVAVGEQVSDVSLASKAVAPARHFFPPRAILLVTMTFIAGVILLGGMSRRRYLELLAAEGQVH
jgi:chromosome segregation ATPase